MLNVQLNMFRKEFCKDYMFEYVHHSPTKLFPTISYFNCNCESLDVTDFYLIRTRHVLSMKVLFTSKCNGELWKLDCDIYSS